MQFFRLKNDSKKSKDKVPKKASSMNNIYNDYSGEAADHTKSDGSMKKVATDSDLIDNLIDGQWRGCKIV